MTYKARKDFKNGQGFFKVGDVYPGKDAFELVRLGLLEVSPDEEVLAPVENPKPVKKKKKKVVDGVRDPE